MQLKSLASLVALLTAAHAAVATTYDGTAYGQPQGPTTGCSGLQSGLPGFYAHPDSGYQCGDAGTLSFPGSNGQSVPATCVGHDASLPNTSAISLNVQIVVLLTITFPTNGRSYEYNSS
ncbi:hypothetical protein MKEN_00627600 [Mycena kentingensis (nom. inval.)]|nr:hypothetical protein MKEN_00627600 [Mycena kentingensis (nom. inval.)]